MIEPTSQSSSLKEFSYGVTPSGYKETTPAEALQVGPIYEVGLYQFRLKDENGKLGYDVAPLNQLK